MRKIPKMLYTNFPQLLSTSERKHPQISPSRWRPSTAHTWTSEIIPVSRNSRAINLPLEYNNFIRRMSNLLHVGRRPASGRFYEPQPPPFDGPQLPRYYLRLMARSRGRVECAWLRALRPPRRGGLIWCLGQNAAPRKTPSGRVFAPFLAMFSPMRFFALIMWKWNVCIDRFRFTSVCIYSWKKYKYIFFN